MEDALQFLKAHWEPIFGVVALGIAFLAWRFPQTNRDGKLSRWFQAQNVPPSEGKEFTILVADLDGDDENFTQTQHVVDALNREDLAAHRNLQVLRISEGGDTAENIQQAEATGRSWLAAQNADLLVWGRVVEANQTLRLRFLSASDASQTDQAYILAEDTFELPQSFSEDLSAILAVTVIASLAPAFDDNDPWLAQRLTPIVEKVGRLLESELPSISKETGAAIQHAYATGAWVLGERTGKLKWLQAAVAAFEAALEIRTREATPLDWAKTQNNLGNALSTWGARGDGTKRLQAAVAAYKSVLEIYSREALPLDWAMIQSNLGAVLQVWGERDNDTRGLQEAVTALEASLEVLTKEALPHQWAMSQNNLSNALRIWGAREEGTLRLRLAVAACEAALEVRTREALPVKWATTHINLGAALNTWGEREEGTQRLQAAVAAYEQALEVLTKETLPLDWALTQNNLGNALRTWAEREDDIQRLQAAVAAYEAALEVRTKEALPLDWAMTQNNLGAALRTWGIREEGTQRLQAAVIAFEAALEVYERAGAIYFVDGVRTNLDEAKTLIAERTPPSN